MVIESLAARYYQLYCRPGTGVPVTLLSQPEKALPDGFNGSPDDRIMYIQTPAGPAEIVYITDRHDFELIIQILAYHNKPVKVPPTMGACTVLGLINWGRIAARRKEYLSSGGTESGWPAVFNAFTSDPGNYKDTIIFISCGGYSSISPERAGMSESEWFDKSFRIRIYHECSHFTCRRLYPKAVNVLRDEIVADCIGLCAAFGRYDTSFARLFLGLTSAGEYTRGRLADYLPEGCDINDYARQAHAFIVALSEFVSGPVDGSNEKVLFSLLDSIEHRFLIA